VNAHIRYKNWHFKVNDNKKRYSFVVEKLHENILLKNNKKKNLAKIEILQVFAKRRKRIIHNVVSQRDSQIVYYIYVRSSGFRLSPSLNFKFEFFVEHDDAIKKMRKVTKKLVTNRNFTFIQDPSYLKIKSFEQLTHGLDPMIDSKHQLARAYAPTPETMASEVINAITPGDLSSTNNRKNNHMNIL
jgi:hypothetical protein